MAEEDLGKVDEYMVVERKEIVDFLLNIVGECLRDFQDGQHRSRVAPGCSYMVDVEAYDENWERKQRFDYLFLLVHAYLNLPADATSCDPFFKLSKMFKKQVLSQKFFK